MMTGNVSIITPLELKKKIPGTYWKFKLLTYIRCFLHSFSGCSSSSRVYFKMCLEHVSQPAPICAERGGFSVRHRPATVFSARVGWERETPWGAECCRALVSGHDFGPSGAVAHGLWTLICLPCFAASEVSSLTTHEKSGSSVLGVAGTGSGPPAHQGARCVRTHRAHDLRSTWTIRLALQCRHLTGGVTLA